MQQQREYVGIDLHRRRSVIVRMNEAGEKLSTVRIANDPLELAAAIAKAGPEPEVVVEATYGWYWAADVLNMCGAHLHLAHPLGVKGFTYRRVKNDERDAADLADLLRMGRLPEAWAAPPAVRELREIVRHRDKLVRLRSGLKAQVHAVLGKEGVTVTVSDLFGVAGQAALAATPLGRPFARRVASLQRLIGVYDTEIDQLDKEIAAALRDDLGYRAIQAIPGVGPILAAVFVAEIGDVTRFSSAPKLCCWAGLTPRHRESDTTVHRGHISKQGSKLVRWAAIEAAQKAPCRTPIKEEFRRIAERRNCRPIARTAVARKILTLVFYGLRDGEIDDVVLVDGADLDERREAEA
jgi:transposase